MASVMLTVSAMCKAGAQNEEKTRMNKGHSLLFLAITSQDNNSEKSNVLGATKTFHMHLFLAAREEVWKRNGWG